VSSAAAQETDELDAPEPKVPSLASSRPRWAGFAAGHVEVGAIANRAGVFTGARASMLYRGYLALGVGGSLLAHRFPVPTASGVRPLKLFYLGPWVELSVWDCPRFHVDLGALMGFGRSTGPFSRDGDVLLLQPGVHGVFRLSQAFQLGIGLRYRRPVSTGNVALPVEQYAGFSLSLDARIGGF
jgi:hypothetical protein